LPVELTHTEAGAVIVDDGVGLIGTVAVLLVPQPLLLVAVTDSVTEPLDPAVKVIGLVVVALVIVPLAIVHTYPAAPAGAEAVLVVEPPHTCDGAVIVDEGTGLIVTLAELLLEQPLLLVTVTFSVIVPLELPATKVTLLEVVEPTVVAPVTVQE